MLAEAGGVGELRSAHYIYKRCAAPVARSPSCSSYLCISYGHEANPPVTEPYSRSLPALEALPGASLVTAAYEEYESPVHEKDRHG